MTSKAERFWILLILRYAFGLFFVVAAINQFSAGGPTDYGPDWFAKKVTVPYQTNWLGSILPMVNAPDGSEVHATYYFMCALPYIFAVLAVPFLTGIFLRPAMRLSALLLVSLGVGSYVGATGLDTTAHDFFFAFLLCFGLHYTAQREEEAEVVDDL